MKTKLIALERQDRDEAPKKPVIILGWDSCKTYGKNPEGLCTQMLWECKFLLHFEEADTGSHRPCIMRVVHTKRKNHGELQ